MAIAMDANEVEAMMPKAGTPLADSCLNLAGNSPSLAAASGISAQIIVQPFSAPMPEMMTTTLIRSPQPVPPNIELTASEKGAVDVLSVLPGKMPNTAVSDSM